MISQSLLPEFDHEMGTLRKYLDRFPDGQANFQPHEKSMTAAALASHLVEMVSWLPVTLDQDEIDLGNHQPNPAHTRAELLTRLDRNVVAAREALERTEDSAWGRMWSLKVNGQTMFAMPKIAVVRSMILNHIIHHRGQLSLYYRMLGVPVPATYGPSGDER
jgi:uncharacterized damage-inducible protein DinB